MNPVRRRPCCDDAEHHLTDPCDVHVVVCVPESETAYSTSRGLSFADAAADNTVKVRTTAKAAPDRGIAREYHRSSALVVLVSVIVLVATGAAAAGTVTPGWGMAPWKLGERYIQHPGLVRSERLAGKGGAGCLPAVGWASRVDYYLGVRVAWRRDAKGRLYLVDVATSLAGDRSADGFVVGVSTRGEILRRHPGARSSFTKGPLSLGAASTTIMRRTGKETFDTLVYWFDARGVLTALETFAGGC